VRQTVDRLADDSMLGRDTPSPELDQAAAYVAAAFARDGLLPAGDSGTFVQHYPISRRRLLLARSSVAFTGVDGRRSELGFGPDLALMQGVVPATPLEGGLVLLAGDVDPAAIPAARIENRVVLWLASLTGPGAAKLDAIGATLVGARPAFVLFVPDDPNFVAGAARVQSAERLAPPEAGGLNFTVLGLTEPALKRALPALATVLGRARRSRSTVVDTLPIRARAVLADSAVGTATAPNVVARLPGSDRALRDQVVVFSAHLDHLGVEHGASGDSIYNGADDNASGVAGILELARGLSQLRPRPRRSLLFAVVSGEEKGLWGSAYLVRHPPIPLGRMVADVNIDMIGRGWRDTVGVIGREQSNLGVILDSVAALHPDLQVTPVGDRWPDQHRFLRSDHYNFARRGVPIAFLSSGYSPDYHLLSDEPAKIDAAKEARLLRLVFYFGLAVADRPDRPAWNPAARDTIVEP
jgi:Peptidase family M28